MGNTISVCLKKEEQAKVEAWRAQWHVGPGTITRVLVEERISCAGWEVYDPKMLARIKTIAAFSDDTLDKFDDVLARFIAEHVGLKNSGSVNGHATGTAGPGRKRNHI